MTVVAVGSYTPATGGRGAGIRLVDAGDGWTVTSTLEADSPSYLAWSHDGAQLYAVEETAAGALRSFGPAHRGRAEIIPTGSVVTAGGRPCHLAVHPSGRLIVTSDYSGGTYTVVELDAYGSLGAVRTVIEHRGVGAHPTRQDRPHPHTTLFTPDGDGVVLLDLGLDTVSLHRISREGIVDTDPASVVRADEGTGPRHAVWIAPDEFVVVEEISARLAGYRLTPAGLVSSFEPVPTTTAASPDAWPSELVHLGRGRVAVVNRAPASLALITVARGRAQLLRERALVGHNPRHMALAAGGLVVAYQDDDAVSVVGEGPTEDGLVLRTGSPSSIAVAPPGGRG